jgi:hypothetical protein
MHSQVLGVAENELPEAMLVAQRAINTPEVQRLVEELAKYNLGVCMPHMHTDGFFVDQPSNVIQIEVHSEFVTDRTIEELGTLPVSWRWHDGAVIVAGSCHVLLRKCD